MKKIAENGEIDMESVVDSPGKGKTNRESQQDLKKRETIEGQHAEETTVRKEHDNVSKIFINKE